MHTMNPPNNSLSNHVLATCLSSDKFVCTVLSYLLVYALSHPRSKTGHRVPTGTYDVPSPATSAWLQLFSRIAWSGGGPVKPRPSRRFFDHLFPPGSLQGGCDSSLFLPLSLRRTTRNAWFPIIFLSSQGPSLNHQRGDSVPLLVNHVVSVKQFWNTVAVTITKF